MKRWPTWCAVVWVKAVITSYSIHYTKLYDDDLIAELRALNWGYGNYYIAIWGKPGDAKPWGFKFAGHHISINLSAVGDHFSVTPFFLGTDPAEVRTTKYAGMRFLSKEEDYSYNFV